MDVQNLSVHLFPVCCHQTGRQREGPVLQIPSKLHLYTNILGPIFLEMNPWETITSKPPQYSRERRLRQIIYIEDPLGLIEY
jgi:hypothetical protein